MADPAPVASTFFIHDKLKKFSYLDGIVTLVDAKHFEQQVDRADKNKMCVAEAVEQVAFADRLLLNKTDLVSKEDLIRVEKRLQKINSFAPIYHSEYSNISVDNVLNLNAFDIKRAMEVRITF